MLSWIRRFLAAPQFEGDEEKTRVAWLLNAVLLSFVGAMLVYGVAALAFPNPQAALPIVGVMVSLGLLALFLMRRGYVQPAALLFLVVVGLLLTLVAVFFGGTDGPAMFGYVVVVVAAGLLLGGRAAFAFAGLGAAAGLGLVWAETYGMLPVPLGPNPPLSRWAAMSLFAVLAAALLQITTVRLAEALREARRYAADLEVERGRLEGAVEERTSDLVRRTRYLEATASIARDTAAVLEVQALLSRTVNRISEQFGFYHVGIFMLDPSGEWAVLQAASSEGGQRMLARGHRLKVGEVGIVGYVTGRDQPRISLDVGDDAVFFDNPDLPETRSEMALPLRARGELIGALDVQSREPAAFGEEDIAVLQTLADQVAVAIGNARLFQRVQEGIEAERRAYGELSRQAWADLLRAQQVWGVQRDRRGISPAGGVRPPEVERALRTGKVVTDSARIRGQGQDGARNAVIPVILRGHVIGAIEAHLPEEAAEGGWTPEQVSLMEALADQLADALEDARLYQEAQIRAVREQLTTEVTSRIRETLDVEAVLNTAVVEIAGALGLAALDLRLVADVDLTGRARGGEQDAG